MAMAAALAPQGAALSFLTTATKPLKPILPVSSCAKCTWYYSPVSTTTRLHGHVQSIRNVASSRFPGRSSSYGAFPSPGIGSRVFAAREEVPSEILEDSKFVRIAEEDPRFGPPVLLLLGFNHEEALKIQTLLKDMEGDFLQVLLCTEEMAQGTLGAAVNVEQPNLSEVQVAKGLPRISFISGLTGEEIMMLIQIFPEAGLAATVFAAHVPLNTDKSLGELMEEIMDDHRRLRPRESVSREES